MKVRRELLFWSRWSGKISLHEGTHYLGDRHLPGGGISKGKDRRNSGEARAAGDKRWAMMWMGQVPGDL